MGSLIGSGVNIHFTLRLSRGVDILCVYPETLSRRRVAVDVDPLLFSQ